ncbi:MAG: hypothetical protein ACRC37_03050, partial [Lentisphaeria bacterium]
SCKFDDKSLVELNSLHQKYSDLLDKNSHDKLYSAVIGFNLAVVSDYAIIKYNSYDLFYANITRFRHELFQVSLIPNIDPKEFSWDQKEYIWGLCKILMFCIDDAFGKEHQCLGSLVVNRILTILNASKVEMQRNSEMTLKQLLYLTQYNNFEVRKKSDRNALMINSTLYLEVIRNKVKDKDFVKWAENVIKFLKLEFSEMK